MRHNLTVIVDALLSFPLYVVAALVVLSLRALVRRAAHRYRLVVLTLAVYVATVPAIVNRLAGAWERRYPAPTAVQLARIKRPLILVLTSGWLRAVPGGYESRLGEAGWERLWAGVQLWKRIGGDLLFTGAPTPDRRDSGADQMARVARQLGVPAAHILIERRALDTHENMTLSAPLIPPRTGAVVLVTSALHMPRAYATAVHTFRQAVIAYPCDDIGQARYGWLDWLPRTGALKQWESLWHEWLGYVAYETRGWS